MNFYVMTLFPEMIRQGVGTSITGRAIERGLIDVQAVDIRDYSKDKYRHVDDYPYGGGAGMVMQPGPIYDCYQDIVKHMERPPRVVYMTPQGRVFSQEIAEELSREENLIFLCGHYEGVDERILEEIVTDHVSIGDYVLTGGELPAMVMIDAISRLVPGVLSNETSAQLSPFRMACWNILSIQDLRNFTEKGYRKCFYPAIMPILNGGAGKSLWSARSDGARSFWSMLLWTKKTGNILTY